MAANYQEYSNIAIDVGDNFMVVFADARNNSEETNKKRIISGQRLDKNGIFIGNNTDIHQNNFTLEYPKIAYSPDANSFLTVFLDKESDSARFPMAKMINNQFQRKTLAFKLDDNQSSGYPNPAVAYSTKDKTFFVAWQKITPTSTAIYGRLVSADGSKMTQEFPISAQNAVHKSNISISYSPDSNKFIVVYRAGTLLYYNIVSGKPSSL